MLNLKIKPSSIREEKVLRCNDCDGIVDKCIDCGRKFHKTDSVYCISHNTIDAFNYIHLCKDCAAKENNKESEK